MLVKPLRRPGRIRTCDSRSAVSEAPHRVVRLVAPFTNADSQLYPLSYRTALLPGTDAGRQARSAEALVEVAGIEPASRSDDHAPLRFQ